MDTTGSGLRLRAAATAGFPICELPVGPPRDFDLGGGTVLEVSKTKSATRDEASRLAGLGRTRPFSA